MTHGRPRCTVLDPPVPAAFSCPSSANAHGRKSRIAPPKANGQASTRPHVQSKSPPSPPSEMVCDRPRKRVARSEGPPARATSTCPPSARTGREDIKRRSAASGPSASDQRLRARAGPPGGASMRSGKRRGVLLAGLAGSSGGDAAASGGCADGEPERDSDPGSEADVDADARPDASAVLARGSTDRAIIRATARVACGQLSAERRRLTALPSPPRMTRSTRYVGPSCAMRTSKWRAGSPSRASRARGARFTISRASSSRDSHSGAAAYSRRIGSSSPAARASDAAATGASASANATKTGEEHLRTKEAPHLGTSCSPDKGPQRLHSPQPPVSVLGAPSPWRRSRRVPLTLPRSCPANVGVPSRAAPMTKRQAPCRSTAPPRSNPRYLERARAVT